MHLQCTRERFGREADQVCELVRAGRGAALSKHWLFALLGFAVFLLLVVFVAAGHEPKFCQAPVEQPAPAPEQPVKSPEPTLPVGPGAPPVEPPLAPKAIPLPAPLPAVPEKPEPDPLPSQPLPDGYPDEPDFVPPLATPNAQAI